MNSNNQKKDPQMKDYGFKHNLDYDIDKEFDKTLKNKWELGPKTKKFLIAVGIYVAALTCFCAIDIYVFNFPVEELVTNRMLLHDMMWMLFGGILYHLLK